MFSVRADYVRSSLQLIIIETSEMVSQKFAQVYGTPVWLAYRNADDGLQTRHPSQGRRNV